MTMTTISDLPTDLVNEIVSRIPLKYMRAVRLTCKNWNALSQSRSFTKMHIAKEEEEAARKRESRMIVLIDYSLYLNSVVNGIHVDPYTKCKGKLTCLKNLEQVKISQVFHCEGLLLCILKDDSTKVVVWNPYLGQTRWIDVRNSYRGFRYKYVLGYENKKSCRSHKILRFNESFFTRRCVLGYEIYDFDSDLWKTLEGVSPHWHIPYYHHGVSLKGNTYWCATKKKSSHKYLIDHLISFDFTRERFGPLLPLPFKDENGLVNLSCVKEEKLAALFYNEHGIDIWITTTKFGEREKILWSKFLTMDADIPVPLRDGSFFIDEVKKVAMILDFDQMLWNPAVVINIIGETGGYVKQVYLGKSTDENCRPQVFSYVPSLVQIKQPSRGKRKKNKIV